MIRNEHWIKWEPIQNIASTYVIDQIIDNIEGLTIIISEYDHPDKKLDVFFEDSVNAYRCTEESYRIQISKLMIQTDGTDLYKNWPFFKVENSTYLDWLKKESCSFFPSKSFTHFAIVGENRIIDIATIGNPTIKKSNKV